MFLFFGAERTLDLVLTKDGILISSTFTGYSVRSYHSVVLLTIYWASNGFVKIITRNENPLMYHQPELIKGSTIQH